MWPHIGFRSPSLWSRSITLAHKDYRIYPKYSDTSSPNHICSKIWTSTIHYPMLCLKIAGCAANSVDPDETPRSAASHLGLYCLLRPVCPNTYGKYGIPMWTLTIRICRIYPGYSDTLICTIHFDEDQSPPLFSAVYGLPAWKASKSTD